MKQHAFLRTGGGPPGVLFYHGLKLLLLFFLSFIKFIFEPQQLFFKIRMKKAWG